MKRYHYLGYILAASIFFMLLSSPFQNKDFTDLALGAATTSHEGIFNGQKVHCQNAKDILQYCVELADGESLNILWIGNSQLHAINQAKPGDKLASVLLTQSLAQIDYKLRTISYPNLNMVETKKILKHILEVSSLDVVIIPVVFDDFRERGIRSDIDNLGYFRDQSIGSLDADANSLQDMSEVKILSYLQSAFNFNDRRAYLSSSIQIYLYKFRNTVFQIKPETKRRVIPARFEENIKALDDLLQTLKDRGVKIVTYIAPIRQDIPPPYEIEQYSDFKNQIMQLSYANDTKFYNIEEIVPSQFWGQKDGTGLNNKTELDFMHFQSGGHEILSNFLLDVFKYDF
jgi:hypothetical protein